MNIPLDGDASCFDAMRERAVTVLHGENPAPDERAALTFESRSRVSNR